jgi:adenine-specific DNA-methyltransferase
MDGRSLTPQEVKLKQLQDVMPEVFSEGKVDFERLKATLGEDINFSTERYVLNWAGKSDAFKVMQTPSTKTLIPTKDESVDFDTTENIFIEGENLEVLKVLQKSYFGKIKMIYIDPPYNTGNDSFIYPDKFSETKDEYQKRVGDKDEEGYMTKDGMFKKNSKENGQYHSNWLNMMYPRIFLAKNLLKQDGVIFISIDDNEVHNLRMIMNEVFGEENFMANIVWEKRFTRSNNSKTFATLTEHILCYRKTPFLFELKAPRDEKADSTYSNPDNDQRGIWTSVSYVNPASKEKRPNLSYELINPFTNEKVIHPTNAWKYEKEKYLLHQKENRLYWGQNGNNTYPRLKRFLSEMNDKMVPVNFWNRQAAGTTDEASKQLDELMEGKLFDFPKPHTLILKAMGIGMTKDDIILDFFAGSGTTAQAVIELNKKDNGNRKFICVQLPELTDEKSEAFKAGYKTIAEISKERIRRASNKINEDLGLKIEDLNKKIEDLNGQLPTDENKAEIEKLKIKVEQLKSQDLGFKVLKLSDSNFKQWQQLEGKDLSDRQAGAKALEEQMQLFVDPISENATIENMVYELLLKSGKSLTSTIEHKNNYFCINTNEVILMLEKASQEIIDAVLQEKPKKVIALDRLFKENDQLKTNTALQMRDADIEFKTI